MSSSFITLPSQPEWNFATLLDANMALVQKLFNMTLNLNNVKVERLSFIDYTNQCFYPNFPSQKRLSIHNTSTLEKFGFGRYAGHFFDVIARTSDGNPANYRIFYEIDETQSVPTPTPAPTPVQHVKMIPSPPIHAQDTIYILGQDRQIIKKGRASYIEYEGKMISLTEAKKLARQVT